MANKLEAKPIKTYSQQDFKQKVTQLFNTTKITVSSILYINYMIIKIRK